MSALLGPVEFDGDPTFLYRLYAADGTLLYLGIAASVAKRMTEHRSASWWPEVTRRTMTLYGSRKDACEAETGAIDAENPRHNRRTTSEADIGRPVGGSLSLARADAEREATWEAGEWVELFPGGPRHRKFVPGNGALRLK